MLLIEKADNLEAEDRLNKLRLVDMSIDFEETLMFRILFCDQAIASYIPGHLLKILLAVSGIVIEIIAARLA